MNISAIMETMDKATKDSGCVKYLQDGDIKVRFVVDTEDGSDFVRNYDSMYKDGSMANNYLIKVVIYAADGENLADPKKVVYLRIPGTLWKLIKNAIKKEQEDGEVDVFAPMGSIVILTRLQGKPIQFSATIKEKTKRDTSACVRPDMDIDAAVNDQIEFSRKSAQQAATNGTAVKAKAKAKVAPVGLDEEDEALFETED